LLGFELQVAITGRDAEERSHALGLENSERALLFAIDLD
jgi:hypothetical protein